MPQLHGSCRASSRDVESRALVLIDIYPYSYKSYSSAMETAMRVTSKGQVTIPADIRKRFGLLPDTEIEFVVEGNDVKIVRAAQTGTTRGDRAVRRLRGRAVSRMTTDEILALTREP